MDLIVPQLSSTMETARVVRWLKRPGERLRMGEPVVEVETDKATMEIESPVDGILTEVLVSAGEEAAVAGTLGRLAAEGDSAVERVEAASGGRIKASPLARRLAAEAGVDLRQVRGSGPGARIRKRDLPAMRPSDAAGASVAALPGPRPLSAMRAKIAETVFASRQSIPSYSLDRWVETGHLAAEQARIAIGRGIEKITFTDMLLQALSDALSQIPAMLDRWLEGAPRPSVIASRTIDIGLIVALGHGLLIPTLSDVGGKDVGQIARARHQAVGRARAGRLTESDHAPAPITLSNLGRSGVDRFEAIISPGQSSILAVGREHERALASGGRLYAARGVNLTLSVDHRLIDGRLGAEFLGLLAERIERGSWRGGG